MLIPALYQEADEVWENVINLEKKQAEKWREFHLGYV
jgi:type IV secretory pathway TrbF-like protein